MAPAQCIEQCGVHDVPTQTGRDAVRSGPHQDDNLRHFRHRKQALNQRAAKETGRPRDEHGLSP